MIIVCLLGFLLLRRRYGVAAAWAVVFTAVFLDDALMLHEGAGAMMAARVAAPAVMGLGYSELGELLGWAVMGAALGTLLLLAYLRASKEGRKLSRGLFVLLGALAFFGVVMDMLHTLAARKYLADALLPQVEATLAPAIPALSSLLQVPELSFPIAALSVATVLPALALSLATFADALQGALRLDLLFTLIEDGGEMVVVSLTAAYCLMVAQSSGHDARARHGPTPDQPLPYLPDLPARKRG